MTVLDSGLEVLSGGITVHDGISELAGLLITENGIVVETGGMTINNGGLELISGNLQVSDGVYVTGIIINIIMVSDDIVNFILKI
jgi:hypothetical protein